MLIRSMHPKQNWLLTPVFVTVSLATVHCFCLRGIAQTPEQQLAGDAFENIQVLDAMPAEQMGKVMNLMSESLGVGCTHCHQGYDFAQEGVPQKDIAREMLTMTFKLNQDHFGGSAKINCNTCHRGAARPDSRIVFQAQAGPKPVSPAESQPASQPTVERILQRYLQALGEEKNLQSIKNRKIVARRVEPNGKTEPEHIWQVASGESRLLTEYETASVIEGFDGTRAWKTAQGQPIALKPDEAALIRRDALLAFPSHHLDYFDGMEFSGRESLDGREAYVLERKASQQTERLFFGAQSGLLIRSLWSVPTVLGEFAIQVDYRDYRPFENVQIPTRIEYAMPGVHWVREVREVQANIEMNETLFREN